MAKKHRWGSEGEKRTITVVYKPSQRILKYLVDMRSALVMALAQAYILAKNDDNKLPSPIALRGKVKPWFDSACGAYAKHHVNPVCRAAVALLRAYKKRNKRLGLPHVRKLAMRIDSELFKVAKQNDRTVSVRVTLEPFQYDYIVFTPCHKKWSEYSAARISEILITDTKLCFTFTMGVEDHNKLLGKRFMGLDLNFRTVDSSAFSGSRLESPRTEQLRRVVQVQNDFSRRRRRLQLNIRNPQKRYRKLIETRGRQRNRVKDMLHKMSTRIARENMDTTFILENLRGIRVNNREEEQRTTIRSRKVRTYLNRWPYRMFQRMVEYKSWCRTLYVSPRGTSSECPVCGGKLEHPAWAVSRCRTCRVDYNRNRLASLAILLRGLRLCDQPFAVSATASWQSVRNEYLYTLRGPEAGRAGWTRDCQRTE